MNIQKLMAAEASLINRFLRANGIHAGVRPKLSVEIKTGYLVYGLAMAMNERFANVERLQRELSAAIGNHRRRAGLNGDIQAIPVSTPRLALEVPHPCPKPLLWSPRKVTTTASHTMLIGRSYIAGPNDEHIAFDDAPHTLICGITGAGKSVLMQTAILSLAAGTSPEECKMVLVDLKNEDLVPFADLPHTLTFAGSKAGAADAISYVVAEKEKRIEQRSYRPFRLVLVIDEMAQIAGDAAIRDALGDLASVGRSLGINLIGATQHPTEKGGLGSLLKANFPVRLVGMVAPGQSHIATGRPQTHADLLPGKGAFLRCQGPNVHRFQSFYIEPNDVALMVRYIAKDVWNQPVMEPVMGGYDRLSPPVITGYEGGYDRLHTSECETPAITGYGFPVSAGRPLTDEEQSAVRVLAATGDFDWQGVLSINRLCKFVYGSKDNNRLTWIREALDGKPAADNKIIKLRRSA